MLSIYTAIAARLAQQSPAQRQAQARMAVNVRWKNWRLRKAEMEHELIADRLVADANEQLSVRRQHLQLSAGSFSVRNLARNLRSEGKRHRHAKREWVDAD